MFLKASKFFLYTALFSIVVVLPKTFFPFIGGKYYAFRLAVELSLVFFVLWWAFAAKSGEVFQRFKRLIRQPLFIGVSAFVLTFLLAAVFAYDSSAAFWSNYERGDGGFHMIHYYLFFALLLLTFERRSDWRLALHLSLAAALLMILYGFFGIISLKNPDLFCIEGQSKRCFFFITPYQGGQSPGNFWHLLTDARFQGSLGNPAYVAPHLLFTIFFAAYLWASSRNQSQNSLFRGILYGSAIIIFFFFFVLSQTKGAFLGLGAALIAILLYFIFFDPRVRKWGMLGLGIVVVIMSLLYAYRGTEFVRRLPGSRLLELSPGERTVQTRLWTWNSALKGLRERPIFGWGSENFSAVFDRYFDSRHFVPEKELETWFDRAHSVIFDYAAETGILGLAGYLSIFTLYYIEFFRSKREVLLAAMIGAGEERDHRHRGAPVVRTSFLIAVMFALPIGYLIQGLAIFDVLPIYLPLFLFLAFATWLYSASPRVAVPQSHT